MNSSIQLSLCIPTNGILEWVSKVLDSIYEDACDENEYEVIITDNGDNEEFQEHIERYSKRHSNLKYKKTDSFQFLNQIDAFSLAEGTLIKFVNHRLPLKKGTVKYLIEFSKKYENEKPGLYFSNGVLKKGRIEDYKSFDEFVRSLSYWSSWSAGTAIWKCDFEKIDLNMEFNKMFPHTDLVFSEKNKQKYVIDDKELFDDIDPTASQKGKYDLFDTFAVKYIDIIRKLTEEGYISQNTFLKIKKENLYFVMSLYVSFVLLKRPCSYDLSSYSKSIKVYYNRADATLNAVKYIFEASIIVLKNRIGL